MNIGSHIREARHSAGFTQAALARQAGMSQPQVAQLERPTANPRIDTVERVLTALGWTLRVERSLAPVDVTQIDARLALSPAERLRRHDRARRGIGRLVAKARRVDD